MFTTLVESGVQAAHDTRSTTLSMIIHGGLIALAVALTATKPGSAAVPAFVRDTLVFVVRPVHDPVVIRHATSSAATQSVPAPTPIVVHPPTSIGQSIPLPNLDIAPTTENDPVVIGHSPSGSGSGIASGSGPLGGAGGVIDAELADKAPFVLGNAPVPRYPSILRETGTTGHVTVRFVVDTLGRTEPGSIAIVESSHALFADAVKNALPSYRFAPGEVGGRKVRTLVQMPFTFSIR